MSSPIIYAQDSLVLEKNECDFLCGTIERNQLQAADFGEYFFQEYANYQPNQEVLNKLENSLYSTTILIVLATWCHDSHQQIPRMYKILDKMDYNTSLIKLVCLNKEKSGCDTDISTLDIERVPTFIFFKNGDETGRIVETPEKTLERDLLIMLSH